MPPFFKLTLVVLCAYILWTFNHPDQYNEPMLPNRPIRNIRPGYPYRQVPQPLQGRIPVQGGIPAQDSQVHTPKIPYPLGEKCSPKSPRV